MARISMLGTLFALCIAFTSAAVISRSDEVVAENLRKLAVANNELAFNLHRKLASASTRNVFFSPLSISTALGMLFYGARGDTTEELREALGYEKAGLLSDVVPDSFSRYFSEALQGGDTSGGIVLKSANSILVDKRLELIEEYRRNVQELYRAVVRDVDFAKEAPRIVEEINDWVKEETNGKIEKILDNLSPATRLALLNAVYFKGAWNTQFDPKNTINKTFFNSGLESEAKNVSMMRVRGKFSVAFLQDFRALELPYKGENVSMLILLPKKRDGLRDLENSLNPENLANILESMRKIKMDISLPKFKLEFEEELSGHLKALGANRVFSSEADFAGMTRNGGVSVSEVLHKAVIEVNEEGSEAAAVTGPSFRSGPIPFNVDHPFLFSIIEKGGKRNMVLFIGRVNKL